MPFVINGDTVVISGQVPAVDGKIVTTGKVGPGGLFLKHKHTRVHARDRFQPAIFDRSTHEDWQRRGGKDATAVAAERVDELLATHRPEPLPARTQAAVDDVVARALDRARRA